MLITLFSLHPTVVLQATIILQTTCLIIISTTPIQTELFEHNARPSKPWFNFTMKQKQVALSEMHKM